MLHSPDLLNGAEDMFDNGLTEFDDVWLACQALLESVQDSFVFPLRKICVI